MKINKDYLGIRFTADGYDCALPVSVDSHNTCSFNCLYCFSDFLLAHTIEKKCVKQYDVKKFEKILSMENTSKFANTVRMALKRNEPYPKKYPCTVQCGALFDPFCNIENKAGWIFDFIKVCEKYNQPVRFSTKGNLLTKKEYQSAFKRPELFWIAFSIITIDDDIISKIDKYAPNATERLKAMKIASKMGIKTSLRLRPAIPNVTDKTRKHPKAYKELIEKAAEAGAEAISLEVLFSSSNIPKEHLSKWLALEKITGINLRKMYDNTCIKKGACSRISRSYIEDFFYKCQEVAKKCGLTFAVSDPIMKHLNDTGCCCGIKPNDPVFGNWQRENATQAVVDARDKNKEIVGIDYIPKWSKYRKLCEMCSIHSSNPQYPIANRKVWADKLIETWNDLKTNRGTLWYFQNILKPIKLNEQKYIVYKYNEPKRTYKKSIFNCE